MDRAPIQEGIRRMRLTDVLSRSERSELGQMEAAELLGLVSARSVAGMIVTATMGRRVWLIGGRSRRHGVPRWRRSSGCWACIAISIAASRSSIFTSGWANGTVTPWATVTKLHLHRSGLVRATTKRSAHRKKRPRRSRVGMMLHQYASTHVWLPVMSVNMTLS
jgi:hypothetical protein